MTDSLAATELSSRLRSACEMSLSPTLVFEHPDASSDRSSHLEQLCGTITVASAVVAVKAAGTGASRSVCRQRRGSVDGLAAAVQRQLCR